MKPANEWKFSYPALERTSRELCAYGNQKRNALRRGKGFDLTFAQWLYIWLESGRWLERGKEGHQYCMSRVGDKGGYEIGNVFIQTNRENLRQGNLGKKPTYQKKTCGKCGRNFCGNGMGSHMRACSGPATRLGASPL